MEYIQSQGGGGYNWSPRLGIWNCIQRKWIKTLQTEAVLHCLWEGRKKKKNGNSAGEKKYLVLKFSSKPSHGKRQIGV